MPAKRSVVKPVGKNGAASSPRSGTTRRAPASRVTAAQRATHVDARAPPQPGAVVAAPPSAAPVATSAVAAVDVPSRHAGTAVSVPHEESAALVANTGSRAAAPRHASPAAAVQSCQASSSSGALVAFNLTTRGVAIGIGKAGVSIADGLLLSSSAVLNPIVSASFVVYESVKAIQAYRHGDLNTLGYRTTKGDVALRIGKEVTTTAIGMAIGHGVGALIGLSAIPVAGQLVVATVLSVGLGICVGTLLTHYVDRFMARLQLRNQYGYPMDERGSRRRFEVLMDRRHDLATLETCRLVQHYADYRVACGWESPNDLDDYRGSGDITRMPVSLQHFAVVQLQRKWGFVKERAQCRQIYRALLLVHHPDRGGATELAAQLNKDFEFFAFCQGWDSDCAALLRSSAAGAATAPADGAARRSRGNVVVDYLRSLFRPTSSSHVGANDLHQFGLLTLEAGTPAEMHRRDVVAAVPHGSIGQGPAESSDARRDSLNDIDSVSDDDDDYADTLAAAAVRQRSVTRILHAVHEMYRAAAEAITFAGLIQVSDDAEQWAQLHRSVSLFQRLQYYVSVQIQARAEGECATVGRSPTTAALPCAGKPHTYRGFRWSTVQEAVAKREEARGAIVAAVFASATSEKLTSLLELWRTAKAIAESYFRVCQQREADGRPATSRNEDEGRQTLDALMRIHAQVEEVGAAARAPWQGRMEDWATRTVPGFSSFMEDVQEVGLTASNALAAEYAAHAFATLQQQCGDYFKAWSRKQNTLRTLLTELQLEYATLRGGGVGPRGAADGSGGGTSPSSTPAPAPPSSVDVPSVEAAKRIEDYQTQLLLLHKQMAEVDRGVAEWVSTCAAHFPELTPTLRELPSTCVQSVAEREVGAEQAVPTATPTPTAATPPPPPLAQWTPRFAGFERERTLLHYTRLEAEPVNPYDPFFSRLATSDPTDSASWVQRVMAGDDEGGIGALVRSVEVNESIEDAVLVGPHNVGVTLLQALYNDPLTGEITPCWLKRYAFSAVQANGGVTVREVARRTLAAEVAISLACGSDRVVSAHDIFYHRERRELFVHYVRGATQQRFRSVNDVRRQVEPLGLRWLHDVLECVVCLHACHIAHGHLRLSSFTYDDFGNTALGVFFPVSECASQGTSTASSQPSLADRQHCDVMDLGVMLMTEVLPLLTGGRSPSTSPAAQLPSTPAISPTTRQALAGFGNGAAAAEADAEDAARVLEAVAEHLLGKEEPRWSLLDARDFVRRFQQIRTGDLAIFSKQVTYPASWAMRGAAPPVQLVSVDAALFHLPATLTASATVMRFFHNRHVSLWETYWRCRRKMMTLHRGNYALPSSVAHAPPILSCSDDCEVRERYLWCACADEEEAWERCQDGFRGLRRHATQLTPRKDMLAFALTAPASRPSGGLWAVLCRVALGTTVEQTQAEFDAAESEADTATSQFNKLAYAALRRSHFLAQQSAPAVWVPCPWARAYPEFLVHIS